MIHPIEKKMVFNSFEFVVFFVVVLATVRILTKATKGVTARNVVLLVASYWFYGQFNPMFLAVLLYVTLTNYIGVAVLYRYKERAKTILGSTVVLTLLPLLLFKYTTFLYTKVLGIDLVEDSVMLHLALPVGISFFSFQALTYTIDVYRRKIAEKASLLDFALFVAFFPTILSGPIEKARNFLPQLKERYSVTLNDVITGTGFYVWGLFKKMVIADRLSQYVDWAYSSADYVSSGTLALAVIFYSIQIYCDFSGYSDMAIGIARCLGFQLSANFNFPYFSTKIKDFWRKWHISLTSWFTEYVYYSLGGNRVRLKARWIFNISMVFLLSGIWHGAAWNFLLWGAIHALLYLTEYTMGLHDKEHQYKNLLQKVIAGTCVFVAVSIAWVFFRVEDVATVHGILAKIVSGSIFYIMPGASTMTFVINLVLLALFGVNEIILHRNRALGDAVVSRNVLVCYGWICSCLLLIALFGRSNDSFVYFQF